MNPSKHKMTVFSQIFKLIPRNLIPKLAKHRRRKAAAKMHLRLDLHSFLPSFVVVKTAKSSDPKEAWAVCAGVKDGEIEVFFKEIKQTLKLADFVGYNENAIRWQIWTALLTYILLRFIAWQSKWSHSFMRLFTVLRGVLWSCLVLIYQAFLNAVGQQAGQCECEPLQNWHIYLGWLQGDKFKILKNEKWGILTIRRAALKKRCILAIHKFLSFIFILIVKFTHHFFAVAKND